jgi:hypothetical protein
MNECGPDLIKPSKNLLRCLCFLVAQSEEPNGALLELTLHEQVALRDKSRFERGHVVGYPINITLKVRIELLRATV